VSLQDYVSRIDDVGFWRPYVAEIMERLDPTLAEREPAAGYNATWPTFLYGEFVVKLFGSTPLGVPPSRPHAGL
jgi:hygromycin-B 7''-O-kinase